MIFIRKKESLLKSINYFRFLVYTVESYPIIFIRKFFGPNRKPNPLPPQDHRKKLIEAVNLMIEEDTKNIENKIYSQKLVFPENPIKHGIRYIEILKDSLYSSLRAKKNFYNQFSPDVKKNLHHFPKYYQRNFHFQTDGYLSKKSAQLYSHQTEILFQGSLALTRRLLMAPLIQHIRNQKRILRVLELGCGSGEGTSLLLNSCENIHLTAIDLSSPYIEEAKIKTRKYSNVKYEILDAKNIHLFQEQFDIIFSFYLLHEIPEKERKEMIQISYDKLNPSGMMINIESIQLNDVPDFNWALMNFPQDFHEPFYMNYIKRPLVKMMEENKFQNIFTNIRFLSKSVSGIK